MEDKCTELAYKGRYTGLHVTSVRENWCAYVRKKRYQNVHSNNGRVGRTKHKRVQQSNSCVGRKKDNSTIEKRFMGIKRHKKVTNQNQLCAGI